MKFIKNIFSVILLFFASMQWWIIGERTNHAYFNWQHFGSGGKTTMNLETVIIGCIGSFILILCGITMLKYFKLSGTSKIIIKASTGMLVAGLLWLAALIASPFSRILGA